MNISFSKCEKCRICDSMEFDIVLTFDSMPLLAEPIESGKSVPSGPITVLSCRSCGYVFLKEVINSSIYDEYIYTPQASDDVVSYLKQFVRNVAKRLPHFPGQCGLEVGSGDGSLCREFNNLGMPFIGVEPSKVLCSISEEKNKVNTCNSFMDTKFADRIGTQFDMVVVRHVLEHVHDFSSFFESIDKCLKPEGTLIIEVPYLGDILLQKQFYAFFFEHLSYFSLTSLSRLLQRYRYFIHEVNFVYPEGGSVLVYASREVSSTPCIQDLTCVNDSCLFSFRDAFHTFKSRFERLVSKSGIISGYGAGQRGITLLNLLGVSNTVVSAIFDENPVYHGLVTPQSLIPVRSPTEMNRTTVLGKILILASSYDKQIREKYRYIGDRFVSLPELM